MMQFLMSRLQASAISWSSFSACRNSRGLPTETARREAVHGRADSIGRTYQDDSERSSRRKANEAETGWSQPAHKLQTRPPPAKVLAARISMSDLVPLLEFNLHRKSYDTGMRRWSLDCRASLYS